MEKLILLDAGHGGLIHGQYVTPGKRAAHNLNSKEVNIYEGVSNRAFVANIAYRLSLKGIPCHILAPENKDITIRTRIRRERIISKSYRTFLYSVHSDGFNDERAHGASLYTSVGETPSDKYAEVMAQSWDCFYGEYTLRVEEVKARDKEANFGILKYTSCPAVLAENHFHTNRSDFINWLHPDSKGRKLTEIATVEGLINIYNLM